MIMIVLQFIIEVLRLAGTIVALLTLLIKLIKTNRR